VNCAAARDLMPELALGSLATRDAALIDRHLAWCAACRKEADDLHRAAALLPYSLAPASPPEELEARVISVVHQAAGGRRSSWARRSRLGAAALVAAMIAISGLGWGAVMAGRAARLQDQVRIANDRTKAAQDALGKLLSQTTFGNRDDVFVGTLEAGVGSPAGGAALVELTSMDDPDFAIVSVIGVPVTEADRLPFTVTLESSGGATARVGRITQLSTSGEADVGNFFKRDLSGLNQVFVRDADGALVMFGILQPRDPVPSPSPTP
jgi:putative zinc finger protein